MVFSTSFLAFVQGLKMFSIHTKRDDDFADRLSHRNTAMFLLITSILISSKQYVGNPIHCWVPKEFSDPWQKYANSYCWIKNTYIVPPTNDFSIPKPEDRTNLEINYYQWVPIVLLIQALLFYLPSIAWSISNWTIGVNVQDIVSNAMDVCAAIRPDPKPEESQSDDSDEKPKIEVTEKEPDVPDVIKNIAHHLEVSIDAAAESKSSAFKALRTLLCGIGSRKYGFYLVTLYFFTKLLYIINVVGQLFLLNSFIGTTYKFFGFQILGDLINGNDWKNTGHFPRITMCDFEIRNLGQRTNYTVQCVLPINLFNEKIYIFIWFWIFVVAILTIYSFFHWIFRMLSFQRFRFIKGLLSKRLRTWSTRDNELLKDFLNDRLKSDGVFLIYLVYLNAGDLVTKELLEVLWYRHKKRNPDKFNNSNDDYADDAQFL